MNSNTERLCRLCLECRVGLVNVFETFQDSTVASVLAEHFWFQIIKDDGMSEWVCEICWIQTKTFHHFYKKLELRHKNYMNSFVLVKVDEIKEEQSVSPVEEALEADLFRNNYEGELDIKADDDDTQTLNRDDSCDKGNNDSSCNQNDPEQKLDDDDQCSLDKPESEDVNFNVKQHNPSKKERQDAEIRQFFNMKCEICSGVEFDTLKNVRKHYRQVHKTKGYLVCCGNIFKSRWLMLDHVQYHVNPNAHRCDQCGRTYRDRKILREHIKCHVRANKCGFCSSSFSSAAKLKYHIRDKHSTDTSERFPCSQCDKICSTKISLTSHVKNVHDPSMDHVCDICGRAFKQKINMQVHKKSEHSIAPLPKAQCDICGTWLKHERSLRQHLKMHQDMEYARDGKVLNCPICKKAVQTKRALESHVRYYHGERKHQCTFCDKSFKRLKSLQEHIAIHTGADLYSCSYCDRTFKSNANMYSHRKKAHLAEWTRDKKERSTRQQAEPAETRTAKTSDE